MADISSLVEQIGALTLLEAKELKEALEESLGVTAATGGGGMMMMAAGAAAGPAGRTRRHSAHSRYHYRHAGPPCFQRGGQTQG